MGNAGLFREFKNYKMAAISCYTFPFSFISACAPVSLWRLAIALEQMLPAGRRPRVGLILYSGLQFFFILFCEFHEVCWIRFSTWESFVNFHICGSPISTSLACLLTVGVRIFVKNIVLEWDRWRLRCHPVPPTLCIILHRGWIWANYPEISWVLRTTTTDCRVSFIDFLFGVSYKF